MDPYGSRPSHPDDGALHGILVAFIAVLCLIGCLWAAYRLFLKECLTDCSQHASSGVVAGPRPAATGPTAVVVHNGAEAQRSSAF
ncbi:unnamed protein product [Miscanthus streak virus - [Japan 98]]|uniref:ORF V1 n=1 Tax=Miscanthus streak virus - [Japan 98] TaxID=268778 RepID=O72913_9GEMI|nr:unnamed protein product [Miscanthus streak virus - [Japan 98]]